jgi:uncharacterized protein
MFSMSSISPLALVFLTVGFTVGFGHCIGMCGPIVVSLSLTLREKKTLAPHLFYNLGRVITYTLLGALLGLTGSFTGLTAQIAGIQKWVMIAAGIIIILMGLAMNGWLKVGHIFGDYPSPTGIISTGFAKLSGSGSSLAYLPLGLLLGLLPCGPVYTALIAAARTGMEATSPVAGALSGASIMACFGLGTIPSLLLVAKLADLGWFTARQVLYRIGGFLMILVGIYFVYKGIRY